MPEFQLYLWVKPYWPRFSSETKNGKELKPLSFDNFYFSQRDQYNHEHQKLHQLVGKFVWLRRKR